MSARTQPGPREFRRRGTSGWEPGPRESRIRGTSGWEPAQRQPTLPRNFYARSSLVVARELLGMVLVRRTGRTARRGRIVETEAYGGSRDRASHAYRGRTARNRVMFGPPGAAYVYFTYGMHWLLNVVCQGEGIPAAVLIRGMELTPQGRLSGPAKLTKHFRITGTLNGEDLVTSRRLWIERPKGFRRPTRVTRTPRIGVEYAGRAAAWKRRFVLMPSEKIRLR